MSVSQPSQVKHISISIKRPMEHVYDFLSQPENFPKWASGLGGGLSKQDDIWTAAGPEGPITVRFSERNGYGILDHWVDIGGGTIVYIPMRVLCNGTGSEVVFTLFRQSVMTDEKFDADAAWVRKDLLALKDLLEKD